VISTSSPPLNRGGDAREAVAQISKTGSFHCELIVSRCHNSKSGLQSPARFFVLSPLPRPRDCFSNSLNFERRSTSRLRALSQCYSIRSALGTGLACELRNSHLLAHRMQTFEQISNFKRPGRRGDYGATILAKVESSPSHYEGNGQADKDGVVSNSVFAERGAFPPFRSGCRTAGLLMHVTSLPSPYGIGDVGPAAFEWVDRLHDAGQTWWQALPLGPTGYGNSPYSSLSSFAGNGLLISPDLLVEDGLLSPSDCEGARQPASGAVNFDEVILLKRRFVEQAWVNFQAAARPELRVAFARFGLEQEHWLENYALFRALKEQLGGADLGEWPQELRRREPSAMAHARVELSDAINQNLFEQFILFRQGNRLKEYAHDHGVLLIGDLPFFVSLDSSDVWANPECFQLDAELRPRFVAGVPPDYFSATGQLWGNPVYDWDVLRGSRYRWCIERLKSLLAHVDLIRLDHFRAFCAAWHVPPEARTAQPGHWVPGPGADFFQAVQKDLGDLPFIAEDLGIITPDVVALREKFELPGIRVFQFGFDGSPDNPHLPHSYSPNTVAYTGTHDNNTTRGWFESVPDQVRQAARSYVAKTGRHTGDFVWDFMQSVWSSQAGLSIAPLQDLLNLGEGSRMNVPGSPTGNWGWRCTQEMLKRSVFQRLQELTISGGREAVKRAKSQNI
jgi:4-alpha-glucanotransferase